MKNVVHAQIYITKLCHLVPPSCVKQFNQLGLVEPLWLSEFNPSFLSVCKSNFTFHVLYVFYLSTFTISEINFLLKYFYFLVIYLFIYFTHLW